MDKYEYKIRSEEIKALIEQGQYQEAAEIADTIDWRRVKSVMMLCTVSDLYKINRRFEDARDMLLLAYERHSGGRTIVYSLCELSIKMGDILQAVEYLKEFKQIAPRDSGIYILQYKLYEAQEVSLEERIEVLEELKSVDFREKWAYELAYLYHRIGLAARCVEVCDELILWFGEGRYVVKAMELKMLHEPLTPEQQRKYDSRFEEAAEPDYGQNTEYGQEPEYGQNAEYGQEPDYGQNTEYDQPDAFAVKEQEEMDIQVKTMDVANQYNTINLQKELAAGLKEVLGEAGTGIENQVTRAIVAPMMSDTQQYPDEIANESTVESVDESVAEAAQEPAVQNAVWSDGAQSPEEIESSEVFFGETGEIGALLDSQMQELTAPAEEQQEVVSVEEGHAAGIEPQESGQTEPDVTAETVMEQLRQENLGLAAEEAKLQEVANSEPPKKLADVLSMESDGQISLVMPESEQVEKQITGQISIEDILAEWERMKKENEEKRKEAVRQRVLEQTGAMFTEFEASVRDGLLEQLERKKAEETEESDELIAQEAATEDTEAELEEVTETEFEEELEQEEELEETQDSPLEEWEEDLDEEFELEETEPETEEAETEAEEAEAETEEAEPEAEEAETEAEEAEPEAEEAETEAEEAEPEAEEAEPEAEEVEAETEEAEPEAGEAETEEAEPEAEEAEEDDEEAESVERDKVKVRGLTREEKELYAAFVQSKSAREKLVTALDSISLAAYTGNIIVTGEEGMDTMTLAKNMIREVQMTDSNFSGKVAKISARALNKKDVAATLKQLKNGALIIQKASEMEKNTVDALYKALQQESSGIIVVLEDSPKAINRFLGEHEKLKPCFNARMDMEALSNDSLVSFGRKYARELEYSIDEMGVLALHTRIADMQTIDHVVTVMDVKEIVDEAIRHANRKTPAHFFDILFAKRYDEEDMIILRENDFVS